MTPRNETTKNDTTKRDRKNDSTNETTKTTPQTTPTLKPTTKNDAFALPTSNREPRVPFYDFSSADGTVRPALLYPGRFSLFRAQGGGTKQTVCGFLSIAFLMSRAFSRPFMLFRSQAFRARQRCGHGCFFSTAFVLFSRDCSFCSVHRRLVQVRDSGAGGNGLAVLPR